MLGRVGGGSTCTKSTGDDAVNTIGSAVAQDAYALFAGPEEGIKIAHWHAVACVECCTMR